jgi:hypothetical protein
VQQRATELEFVNNLIMAVNPCRRFRVRQDLEWLR